MSGQRRFPDGFLWGTATAAYQVEGAVAADGRGPSIWDTFTAQSGAITGGDTGEVACEQYVRWPEDLDLMADLGIGGYRFSVAWPRILPDGAGRVEQRGLDHYSRLVDGLLERGITPMATLYHWDLPQALQDRGGWQSRATVDAFERYAEVIAGALGDRVPFWVTLNEPWVSSFLGYGAGIHAPGLRDGRAALEAAHCLLLAHGRATQVLSGTPGAVGIAIDLHDVVPAGNTPEDAAAADRFWAQRNSWFLDPLLRGSYPQVLGDWFGDDFAGIVSPGDFERIAQPLDFLGINYYSRAHVLAGDEDGPRATLPRLGGHEVVPAGLPTTAMGWPVEPDGLRALLMRISAEYPELPSIYITENGAAYDDVVGPDGSVDDGDRIAFLDGYLRSLFDATSAGVDVRGYFCWSFLDNFEWAEGYAKRFGLVHVDYPSQRRTAKASARWYADVIARNGLPEV